MESLARLAARRPVPRGIADRPPSLDRVALPRLTRLELAGRGVEGVIIGRAIYEGAFTVPEAIAATRG